MVFKDGISVVRPEVFGKAFLPEKVRLNLESRVWKAGFKKRPYKFFGYYFYFTIAVMIVLYFSVLGNFTALIIQYTVPVQLVFNFLFSIGFAFFFILLALAVGYALFQYIVETRIIARTRAVEAVLQEYLRYVTENLRGGMSFEKSLWASVKPEFGVLAEEIELVTKKVMTGSTLDDALTEFTQKYDSAMVERTFDIIIEALKGGGTIADIIDDIVENLSQLKELKDELVTTNMSYTIFVTAIVLFITPFMFSLASQFVEILGKVGAQVGSAMADAPAQGGGGLMANFTGAALDMESFRVFAIAVLFINSLGAAVLSAVMNKGSWKEGGTSYVVYPLVSIALYLIVSTVFSNLFSSFIPI